MYACCVCACSVAKSCLILCDAMDCSPPDSSIHGIPQARILEWIFPSPGGLPDPGIQPLSLMFSALAGGFFTTSTTPVSNKPRNSCGFKKGLTYVTEDCFSHLLYRCSFLMITKRLSLFQTYILIPQSPGV